MFRRIVFLCLARFDYFISRWRPTVFGVPTPHWDRFDCFMEHANMTLWPDYDGEGFGDYFFPRSNNA